jgi:hypothetical protein
MRPASSGRVRYWIRAFRESLALPGAPRSTRAATATTGRLQRRTGEQALERGSWALPCTLLFTFAIRKYGSQSVHITRLLILLRKINYCLSINDLCCFLFFAKTPLAKEKRGGAELKGQHSGPGSLTGSRLAWGDKGITPTYLNRFFDLMFKEKSLSSWLSYQLVCLLNLHGGLSRITPLI